MTEPARVAANGISFAYLEAGPRDGPLALCLHGFPDSARTWRRLLPRLGAAGWHAVAPWMRGHHPTGAARDGVYQSAALSRDVLALAGELGADGTAVLVGHDWGAYAAVGAAILDPARARRVVSLALPHPAVLTTHLLGNDVAQLKRSWYFWFFQLPSFPEMAVAAADGALVDSLWADWSPGWRQEPEEQEQVRAMLRRPGVAEAAVEYYRQAIQGGRDPALAADQVEATTGRLAVPALFLAGELDGCFAPAALGESAAFCDAEVATRVLADCGHFLHLERPDEVAGLVLDFLGTPS